MRFLSIGFPQFFAEKHDINENFSEQQKVLMSHIEVNPGGLCLAFRVHMALSAFLSCITYNRLILSEDFLHFVWCETTIDLVAYHHDWCETACADAAEDVQ